MGTTRHISLFAASVLIGIWAGEAGTRLQQATSTKPAVNREQLPNEPVSKEMKVTIAMQTFTATLDDNPTAAKESGKNRGLPGW